MKNLVLKAASLLTAGAVLLYIASHFSSRLHAYTISVLLPAVCSFYASLASLTSLPVSELIVILLLLLIPISVIRYIRGRGALRGLLLFLLISVFGYIMTVALPSVREVYSYKETTHKENVNALTKIAEKLNKSEGKEYEITDGDLSLFCNEYMSQVMGVESQRAAAIKKSLISPIFSKLGIIAYYSPLTAEIIVNNDAPRELYTSSCLHELSHYYGILSEDRADLYAYMIADQSQNDALIYSENLSAFARIGTLVAGISKEDYYRIYDKLATRVKKSLHDRQTFVNENGTDHIASELNDAVITMRDARGAQSYRDSAYALVAYINGNK